LSPPPKPPRPASAAPSPPCRAGRSIERIQPREPEDGWTNVESFEPEPAQTCYSVGPLILDDDCVKALAGWAMVVGDEDRVMLSGASEIPASCVVRIVRLVEEAGRKQ
ncbi:hypothetical protein ATE62_14585, partial [Sphingopyxis sp. HIX]|uniref:hypothetical protein n=1 Tax=Sphingopyxis sp. HIX TaxID=1759074 RepID=UPI0007363557